MEKLVNNESNKSLREELTASSFSSYAPEKPIAVTNIAQGEDLQDIGIEKLGEDVKEFFNIEIDDICED